MKSFRTKTLSVYPVTVITSALRVPLWVLLKQGKRENMNDFMGSLVGQVLVDIPLAKTQSCAYAKMQRKLGKLSVSSGGKLNYLQNNFPVSSTKERNARKGGNGEP